MLAVECNVPNSSDQVPQITLVSHFYPAHRGGVEIVAGKLAEELASRHNYKIEWFASNCDSPPNANAEKICCFPQPCWNGLEKRFGIPWPIWSPRSCAHLWRSIRKSDAVHVHDFIYMGSLIAIFSALLLSRPVLITQHIGLVPYDNPVLRKLLSLINRTVGHITLKLASRVVFISSAVHDYFSEFINWKHKHLPLYIPNGTSTEVFHPLSPLERNQIREDLSLQHQELMFLFVGRFVEKKGLLLLEKLAKKNPDIRWFFCGTGTLNPNNWRLPNVHTYEGLSGKSLARIYQAADLLVLPSRGEGFPLVVQESMACGTPALVSTETVQGCPSAHTLLLHEARTEHDSDDEARWLIRINAFKNQISTLQSMRAAVAEFALKNWNWSYCASQYEKILHSSCDPQ